MLTGHVPVHHTPHLLACRYLRENLSLQALLDEVQPPLVSAPDASAGEGGSDGSGSGDDREDEDDDDGSRGGKRKSMVRWLAGMSEFTCGTEKGPCWNFMACICRTGGVRAELAGTKAQCNISQLA